jgi:5-formyltetrahydrofolate cyclo-ligase
MNTAVPEQKAAIRARVRAQLKGLTAAQRVAASRQIRSRLVREPCWRGAQWVLLFVPLTDEPALERLIDDALGAGKGVALPRFDPGQGTYVARQVTDSRCELESGQWGVREPPAGCPLVPLKRLDFVAVPGVAFTPNGRRLGRGKGFYDRLLASVHGIKCGIAFDQQMVDDLPEEPHDIRLDYILTQTRWYRTDRATVLK